MREPLPTGTRSVTSSRARDDADELRRDLHWHWDTYVACSLRTVRAVEATITYYSCYAAKQAA